MKFILSKSKWQEIGAKANWLGKTSATSYTNPLGIELYEGKSLNLGAQGMAKIISMDFPNKIISLTKEDGSNVTMDMDTLEIVTNLEEHKKAREEKEKEKALRKDRQQRQRKRREENRKGVGVLFDSENKSFFLMGFIAANGTLSAQVPRDQVAQYEKEHQEIKGYPPVTGSYDIASEEDKWYVQLRIHIPKTKMTMDIKNLFGILGFDLKETKASFDVNETPYIKKLLALGFDIGNPSKQHIQHIQDNIKKQYGDLPEQDFVAGVNYNKPIA